MVEQIAPAVICFNTTLCLDVVPMPTLPSWVILILSATASPSAVENVNAVPFTVAVNVSSATAQ